MSKPKRRMLNVRLDDEEYGRIEEEAERTGASVSDVVRRLLDEALSGEGEPQKLRWKLARRAIELVLADTDLPLAELWLYGSVARGEATATSDIDLLLVLDVEASKRLKWRRRLFEQLMELEWEHGVHFSLQVLTMEAWEEQAGGSFREEVEETGIRFRKRKDKEIVAAVAA